MCDTLVALHDFTPDGSVLFGKNSDRDPDEAHEIVQIPEQYYPPDQTLKTTYIRIPQVRRTYEVLLAKPFWIWGCEMGVNENGVVIGNEALFLKLPAEKKPGLLGMDLMRLALERSETAVQAIDVITRLLEKYGQGGSCGLHNKKFTYHNSFLIADFTGAFVLETFRRDWAVKKVEGAYSISNGVSLRDDYQEASSNFKKNGKIDLKKRYEGFLYTYFSRAKQRRARSSQLLQQHKGSLNPKSMMQILRDHGDADPDFHPADLGNGTLCMHAADPLVRKSQTVGSFIVNLTTKRQIHIFATGTSAPCLSVFKPVFLSCDTQYKAGSFYNPDSLWWGHEVLHRSLLNRSGKTIAAFRRDRIEFENEIWQEFEEIADAAPEVKGPFSKDVFAKSRAFEARWIDRLKKIPTKRHFFYSTYWRKISKRNGVPSV